MPPPPDLGSSGIALSQTDASWEPSSLLDETRFRRFLTRKESNVKAIGNKKIVTPSYLEKNSGNRLVMKILSAVPLAISVLLLSLPVAQSDSLELHPKSDTALLETNPDFNLGGVDPILAG